MSQPLLLNGSIFNDERGSLKFFNDFKMEEVVRFYEISPANTETVRAWQAHKHEKKWFYCNSGSFIVNLIELDNFDHPSKDLIPDRFVLKAAQPGILGISGGYANGFKALEKDSRLLVFSNAGLADSQKDDYRFPWDYWKANWKNSQG